MPIGPFPPPLSGLRFCISSPRAILLDDLGTKIQKYFIHIRPPSGTGLVVRFLPPTLGELEGSGTRYHAVVFHVCFVAYNDHGDVFVVFDADDLFAEFGQFVEGICVADGKD